MEYNETAAEIDGVWGNSTAGFAGNGTIGRRPLHDLALIRMQTDYIVSGWLTVIVSILGFFGNILSIILIRWRLTMRKGMTTYSIVLAAWDAGLLITACGYYGFFRVSRPHDYGKSFFVHMAVICHPVAAITVTAAGWMVVVITAERYHAVSKPLSSMVRDTSARARHVCIAVALAALLYSMPTFFELRPTGMSIKITKLRQDPYYNYIYRICVQTLFRSLGPFLLISFLSLRMILLVFKAADRRNSMCPHRSCSTEPENRRAERASERAMTRLLLTLAFKFLASRTAPTTLNVWETLSGMRKERRGPIFSILVSISNFLVILNSATNCIVYFVHYYKLVKKRHLRSQTDGYLALTAATHLNGLESRRNSSAFRYHINGGLHHNGSTQISRSSNSYEGPRDSLRPGNRNVSRKSEESEADTTSTPPKKGSRASSIAPLPRPPTPPTKENSTATLKGGVSASRYWQSFPSSLGFADDESIAESEILRLQKAPAINEFNGRRLRRDRGGRRHSTPSPAIFPPSAFLPPPASARP